MDEIMVLRNYIMCDVTKIQGVKLGHKLHLHALVMDVRFYCLLWLQT